MYPRTTPLLFRTSVGPARANIYSGKRVIRASFVYRRGGQNVISWQSSSASVRSCRWSSGSERKKTVYDSLDPNAPTTTFHYSFSMINRNTC